ncbi:MAG: hypothetical protein FJW79_00300 [Actinobacteria bacterium]|nr:hypothetical protein [Actinomycetota bacterium]
MKRQRTWLLLALLLVVALVTSGCFQIRAFSITPKSLAANGTAQVKLSLFPLSRSTLDTQVGRVVLLVGTSNIAYQYASNFDLTGNWGGPVGKALAPVLRNLMRSGGVCSSNGLDAADITGYTWQAIVSTVDLGADPPTAAQLDDVLRVNLGFKAPGDAATGQRGNIIIFSGVWDDGPLGSQAGVPEAGEVACTGMLTFSVPYTN